MFFAKNHKNSLANHFEPWILIFVPKTTSKTCLNAFENSKKITKIQTTEIPSSKKGSVWKVFLQSSTKRALEISFGFCIFISGPEMTK